MTTVGIAALGNSLTAQPFLTTCPTCHRFKICAKSTIYYFFFFSSFRAEPRQQLPLRTWLPAGTGPRAQTPGHRALLSTPHASPSPEPRGRHFTARPAGGRPGGSGPRPPARRCAPATGPCPSHPRRPAGRAGKASV